MSRSLRYLPIAARLAPTAVLEGGAMPQFGPAPVPPSTPSSVCAAMVVFTRASAADRVGLIDSISSCVSGSSSWSAFSAYSERLLMGLS